MKQCPECNRVYTDETLNFCLNDGSELVYGTAKTESPTAILPGLANEAPTRYQQNPDFDSPVSRVGETPKTAAPFPVRNKIWLTALLPLVLILTGLLAYRYFSTANSKQIESIAVMPFANETGNRDMEYLSDGMTDSVISNLSQLPDISVKARGSVFRYKGKNTEAPVIGRELGVQAILNGRLAQHGDDITLFVELIEAATEKILWSENYNRSMTNLVSLQGDIARDVSQKLKTKLSNDRQQFTKSDTANSEAYQSYL